MPRDLRERGVRSWPPPAGRAFGEREVDEEYVARVVAQVTALYLRTAREVAEGIGETLLASFYGGSLEVYRAVGTGHASMLALAQHEALGMPRRLVWESVRYLDQRAELPDGVGERLSLSHHKALFRVRDVELKVRLARTAEARVMSVKELQAAVLRAVGPDEAGRGRKPTPRLRRAVKGLDKALGPLVEERLTRADVEAVSPRELAAVRAQLREYAAAIADLEGQLARLAGPGGRRRG